VQTRKERAPRLAEHETAKFDVPPIVNDVLRSPGQHLERKTRERMESSFGHDFSQVPPNAGDVPEIAASAGSSPPSTIRARAERLFRRRFL
jgi:hypothetical protein